MSVKNEYEMKLREQLIKWQTEIAKIKARTNHADDASHPQTVATKHKSGSTEPNSNSNISSTAPAPQTAATKYNVGVDEVKSSENYVMSPQTVVTLESMYEAAEKKLDELKNAKESDWENHKSEVERLLSSLGDEINSSKAG